MDKQKTSWEVPGKSGAFNPLRSWIICRGRASSGGGQNILAKISTRNWGVFLFKAGSDLIKTEFPTWSFLLVKIQGHGLHSYKLEINKTGSTSAHVSVVIDFMPLNKYFHFILMGGYITGINKLMFKLQNYFWSRISHCSSSWPGTHGNPPVSAPCELL